MLCEFKGGALEWRWGERQVRGYLPATDLCGAEGKVRGDDVLFEDDDDYMGYERTAC